MNHFSQSQLIELNNLATSLYGKDASYDTMEYKMIIQILMVNFTFKFGHLRDILNEYVKKEMKTNIADEETDEIIKQFNCVKTRSAILKCCGYELRDDKIVWFYNEREEPIELVEEDLIKISKKILKY
jgi:hypothetical protein